MKKSVKTAPLTHEAEFYARGLKLICGIDEVGRGCVAGPVVACAVIMPEGMTIAGVNDSKQLSPEKRATLAEAIKKNAVAFGLGWVSAEDIDAIGIQNATFEAMRAAFMSLTVTPGALLIDGKGKPDALRLETDIPCKFIVRGDSSSHSIAAASIVAKVERDAYMTLWHNNTYPAYGFDQHKGYGTKPHFDAIREFGACPLHRKTFLKKLEV